MVAALQARRLVDWAPEGSLAGIFVFNTGLELVCGTDFSSLFRGETNQKVLKIDYPENCDLELVCGADFSSLKNHSQTAFRSPGVGKAPPSAKRPTFSEAVAAAAGRLGT